MHQTIKLDNSYNSFAIQEVVWQFPCHPCQCSLHCLPGTDFNTQECLECMYFVASNTEQYLVLSLSTYNIDCNTLLSTNELSYKSWSQMQVRCKFMQLADLCIRQAQW